MTRRPYRFTEPSAQAVLKKLRDRMKIQDMTALDTAEYLHKCKRAAQQYLKHLHDNEECFIFDWIRGGRGGPKPLYRFGPGVDKPKPRTLTEQEVAKRYRAKRKKDTARYMDYLIKTLKYRHARRPPKLRVKPDPLLAWIPRATQTGE